MRKFWKDESGFIDLSGIQYPSMAGAGAIVGLLIVCLILFPLSFIWPTVWDAAVWVIGGFTVAGLLLASWIK